MLNRWFDRSTSWIAVHPPLATALIVVISIGALAGYLDPGWVKRIWSTITQTNGETTNVTTTSGTVPSKSNAERPTVGVSRRAQIQSNPDAIIVVETPDLFTQAGWDAYRAIVRELESLEHVAEVSSLESVPAMNLFGLADPIFPRIPASPERFLRAKERALSHPFLVGQMISADGQTSLLMVSFDFLMIQSDQDCIEGLRLAAEKAAARFPNTRFTFTVTGRVPIVLSSVQGQDNDRFKYQLIGYTIIVLMSVILFRGVSAVVIVTLASAMGVFWTVGYSRYFDVDFNPLVNVILPVLVSLVGFTDGVHLMTTIRRNRASGATGLEAAAQGIRQVGLACALTSLTTAIGLGSLMLAEHRIVQEFGKCSVVGVTLTFVAVITCIPVACWSPLGNRMHVGHEHSLVEKHLGRIGLLIDIVLKYKRMTSLIGIVLLVIACGISSSLRPDQRVATTLPRSSEAALGMAKMDQAMGGLEFARVDLNWTENRAWDDPVVARCIGRVDEILQNEPLLGHPLSIRTIVAALAGAPSSPDQMSLAELLPPSISETYYNPKNNMATVTFRVKDLGIAAYSPVFERVETQLRQLRDEFPGFRAELTGGAVWRWENLYQILIDLLLSLGSAMVIIFVVLGLVFRSATIGLISIIPNVFPLAAAGVYLVMVGQSLEIVTVCAFTVCLGIAVDDSIHFLARYQEVRAANPTLDRDQAIREAFTNVGTALIITTLVLLAGFASVFLADSRDHIIFATMGTITLTVALFADLLILPALLSWIGDSSSLPEGTVGSSDSGGT
ncbi:MAG: MMPL family transporter [Planctomycetaceae bacterium]|nr:MMPL family transporter [Planctomycetaceae bacterium]